MQFYCHNLRMESHHSILMRLWKPQGSLLMKTRNRRCCFNWTSSRNLISIIALPTSILLFSDRKWSKTRMLGTVLQSLFWQYATVCKKMRWSLSATVSTYSLLYSRCLSQLTRLIVQRSLFRGRLTASESQNVLLREFIL